MPFNGSGVFVRNYSWTQDATNSIPISATRMDADTNDIASGLTNCITRDGQGGAGANIPMGGYKLTNCANAALTNEYVTLGQANGLYQTTLGFTPVQQGGGVGQTTDKIYIGWSAGSKPKMTVNSTDVGNIALESWVSGNYLPLSGGTITGSFTLNSGMTSQGGSGTYNAITINNTSGVQLQLDANANVEGNLRVVTNHPLTFMTNNTLRMTIAAAGDISMTGALTIGGGRKVSKVTLSNAAPGTLQDGELYLQY
ncbi:hypothetical protein ISN75_06885 [Dyella marensis]|uniref:hypothetical protein n=1 Tax=Dyella marensis TaxID=500610 RepID=UPI0031CF6EBB